MSAPALNIRIDPEAGPSFLTPLLISEYHRIKRNYPDEGRRKWLLRTADHFWALPTDAASRVTASTSSDAIPPDDDPFDAFSTDAPTLGIIVRTDYADENAWDAFLARLRSAEADMATDTPALTDASANRQPGTAMDIDNDGEDEDSESDSDMPGGIFTILNPPSPDARAALSGISNLGSLRLLNDVDIVRAPPRPLNTKRAPTNRLIGRGGFQEVYEGKNLWIYDARSNADQSVRVVTPRGETYGTATGDSWRARVSHLPELQINMAAGAMRIDFGGLDRYDTVERTRNLTEAEPGPP